MDVQYFRRIYTIAKSLRIPMYKPKTLQVLDYTEEDIKNDYYRINQMWRHPYIQYMLKKKKIDLSQK